VRPHHPIFFPLATCALLSLWLGAGELAAQVALVRRAPTLNGTVEGSVHVMTAESVTLNGGASVTGRLFVPGTPTIRLNGNPAYGGTLDGSGATAPTSPQITLTGNARLGHVVRRTDPLSLPTVAAPPSPAGTRTVALNSPGQSPGDFATVRHLTLNGGVGAVAVPPGRYGDFTANGSSGFTLGTAGATQPAVYHFQRLTLNGQSTFNVVGPVIVTVANGFNANGTFGASSQPAWLILHLASGGLTLNGNVSLYGYVNAPHGTVTLNGSGQLVGGVTCDRLVLNGNARLRLQPVASPNRPPVVQLTAPANESAFVAPAAFALTAAATDPDGTIAKVEFFRDAAKVGEDTIAPYELAVINLGVGDHVFGARATDNLGAMADSPPTRVAVHGPNQPPTVGLTEPADGALLTAPATLTLAAAVLDPDGTVTRVEFFQGAVQVAEDGAAPFSAVVPGLGPGTYSFSARAVDNAGATAVSAARSVTVVSPNQSPTVSIVAPISGARFSAPASFTVLVGASDSDGVVTKVELRRGTDLVGEGMLSPYEFAVNGLAAGTHAFVARAHDNAGGATDSAAVAVIVTSDNAPPIVSLTAPADGAVLSAPASPTLAATAADSDGTIARVEFYADALKVGEAVAVPYEFVWANVPPGNYVLTAKATDQAGASTLSAPRTIVVQAVLPYFTSFEPAHRFTPGPLAGQGGWAAMGDASIVAGAAYEGTQSVLLAGSLPATQVAHGFPPYAEQPVVFVDFFARAAAGPTPSTSTQVLAEFGRVALVQAGSEGELFAFNGDGLGGGAWEPTGSRHGLTLEGQSTGWLRLTLRGDFTARIWDLYAGGRLVAIDRRFAEPGLARLAQVSFVGHGGVAMQLDEVFVGFDNPLFADADKDGLDDAWEVAHGLDPALNDRAGDRDGDGLSNLQEFQLGTSANAADTDADGVPDGLELLLGRSPLKPAVPDTAGVVNLRLHSPVR